MKYRLLSLQGSTAYIQHLPDKDVYYYRDIAEDGSKTYTLVDKPMLFTLEVKREFETWDDLTAFIFKG